MRSTLVVSAFFVLCLAGCGGFARDVSPGPAVLPAAVLEQRAVAGCEAGALARLEGAHFTRLAEVRLKGQLRVLWPQQDVTRDLLPERLNVQVDRSGTIQRMFCG